MPPTTNKSVHNRTEPVERQAPLGAATATVCHPTPSAPPDMYHNDMEKSPKLVVERPLGHPQKSPEKSPHSQPECRPLAPKSPPPPPPQNSAKNPHFYQQKNLVDNNDGRQQNAYDYLDDHHPQPPPPEFRRLLSNGETKSARSGSRASQQTNWCQVSRNASIRIVRRGRGFVRTLYAKQNGTMFKICLAELVLTVSLLGIGILCVCEAPQFCPYYSAIWCATIFLVNVVLGLVATKLDIVNMYVANLLFSIGCILLALLCATLSAINWQLIGTYKAEQKAGRQLMQPKADEAEMYREFCLVGEYDAHRIREIYTRHREYGFRECLLRAKIGFTANGMQFVLCICLGALFIASAIYCLLRICRNDRTNVRESNPTRRPMART